MNAALEYWLSLDLSSSVGTLSLHSCLGREAPILLKENVVTETFKHSEKLIGVLSKTLSEQGLDLSKVSRVITTSGPGSYTGLRIAAATLKAFAMANEIAIETMSGSEARALAWANTQKDGLPWDEVFVLTHLALDRFVSAHFRVERERDLRLVRESVVKGFLLETDPESAAILVDEKTPLSLIPTSANVTAFTFPLRARYLSEALPSARSRKTYSNLAEWIRFSPEYFGDTKY